MDRQTIAAQLTEILKTPVSLQLLNQITDKQKDLLAMMIENITKPNTWAFYYKNEEDSRKVIYSILDYGKNKLKPKQYSDKTNHYLHNKLKTL